MSDCPFCDILAGEAPAEILASWQNGIAIVPLNPVVPRHTLIIPRNHVQDATTDPATTAAVMGYAAEFAEFLKPCNIITSVGVEATQSVMHLHVHIVPRRADDGLHLPWTDQQRLPLPQPGQPTVDLLARS